MGVGIIRNGCIKEWDLVGIAFQEWKRWLWSFISQGKVAITWRPSTDWLPPSRLFQHLQKSRDAAHKKGLASVTACVWSCLSHVFSGSNTTPTLPICSTALPTGTFGLSQLVNNQSVFQYMACLFDWIIHITPLYIYESQKCLHGHLLWKCLCLIKEAWCECVFSRPGYK